MLFLLKIDGLLVTYRSGSELLSEYSSGGRLSEVVEEGQGSLPEGLFIFRYRKDKQPQNMAYFTRSDWILSIYTAVPVELLSPA